MQGAAGPSGSPWTDSNSNLITFKDILSSVAVPQQAQPANGGSGAANSGAALPFSGALPQEVQKQLENQGGGLSMGQGIGALLQTLTSGAGQPANGATPNPNPINNAGPSNPAPLLNPSSNFPVPSTPSLMPNTGPVNVPVPSAPAPSSRGAPQPQPQTSSSGLSEGNFTNLFITQLSFSVQVLKIYNQDCIPMAPAHALKA